jgi:transketolase
MNQNDTLCINTIRVLAADTVQKSNSGHPGMPMGMAPIAHLLFSKFLSFSPKNPHWDNRDRWILSNGHGSALQYVMLHLTGYNMTMDDLKAFRQLDSKTPGHPENGHTDGVEVTTGPLGQGLCNGVGMAIALEHSKSRFNTKDITLLDHHIFVFCGDGCLMEGITSEASSLAGHLELGALIVFYDDNKISIDGDTNITFTEDVVKRYEAYGWFVQTVVNGNEDLESMEKCVLNAKNQKKPSLIALKTIIGYGSKNQGKHGVHGTPLGEEDLANVKKKFGFDPTVKFHVDDKVYTHYNEVVKKNVEKEHQWNDLFAKYEKTYPELAKEYSDLKNGKIVDDPKLLPIFDKKMATRKLSNLTLNKLASLNRNLIGGSADLAASNLTDIVGDHEFQPGHYDGRNIRFGVREHGMAAIANGIRAHSNYIPFVATFLNFVGYMMGAVRLSALSKLQVIYIMTHDSIGLGEDGPTHQPIETLCQVRSMPNMLVFRPCDGNEVNGCYLMAMRSTHSPSLLSLTRQEVPQLEGSSIEKTFLGGYVLQDSKEKPKVILVSTGSEVSICVEAVKLLGVDARVVSMPSMELFEKQPLEYRQSVLLQDVPVLSVEAASTFGWSKYSHSQLGMTTFGKSAPFEKLYEFFGFTPKNIAERAKKLMNYYEKKVVPNLFDSDLMK